MKHLPHKILITLIVFSFLLAGCLNQPWSEELPEQGFHFVSDNYRLSNNLSPSSLPLENSGVFTAWKGEMLNVQALAYSFEEDNLEIEVVATNELGQRLLPFVKLYRQGWVLGDKKAPLYADKLMPLKTNEKLVLKAKEILPLWLQIELPREIDTGIAKICLVANTQKETFNLPIEIKLLDLTLGTIKESSFNLNFWQNPYAFARMHDVELWSEAHFEIMKPYMEKLASIGQRAVTTSIIDKPWNGQTYDAFGSMIDWRKAKDGTFTYDYTIFDKWVEFAEECGIDEGIHCYTMIPWHNKFQYFDENLGEYTTLVAVPGSKEFEAHWAPFLADFQEHLIAKGWLEKTSISMDERAEELMTKLFSFVRKAAPQLTITSACDYQAAITDQIHDISTSLQYTTKVDPQWIANRKAKGQITTYYVCTNPPFPNTFTHSEPAEAQWLGWYAIAENYDGLLRWAYNSWPENPSIDSSFGGPGGFWPAGDTFLIYPAEAGEPYITSVRLEKLIDGIEDYLKVQASRELIKPRANAVDFNKSLDALLSQFKYDKRSSGHKEAELVKSVEKAFNELVEKSFELY